MTGRGTWTVSGILCFFYKANPLTFLDILGFIQLPFVNCSIQGTSALALPALPPPQGVQQDSVAKVPAGFWAETIVSELKSRSSIFKSFPEAFHLCEYKRIFVKQYIPKYHIHLQRPWHSCSCQVLDHLLPVTSSSRPFLFSVCFDFSTNLTTSSLLEHFLLSAFARLLPLSWFTSLGLFLLLLCPLHLCDT